MMKSNIKKEEDLFKNLMDRAMELEGKRLLAEAERLKHDPASAVPPELDKKCRKIIENAFK